MNLFQHNSLCSFSSRLAEHCSRSLVGSLLLVSAPALPLLRCALGALGGSGSTPPLARTLRPEFSLSWVGSFVARAVSSR